MIENTAIEQLLPWESQQHGVQPSCSSSLFFSAYFPIVHIFPLCVPYSLHFLPKNSQWSECEWVANGWERASVWFSLVVCRVSGEPGTVYFLWILHNIRFPRKWFPLMFPYIISIIYMFVWHNLHHRFPLSAFWFSSLSSPRNPWRNLFKDKLIPWKRKWGIPQGEPPNFVFQ